MMTIYSVDCCGVGVHDNCSDWWIERMFTSAESAEKYVKERYELWEKGFAEKRARHDELDVKNRLGGGVAYDEWKEMMSIRNELYEEFCCYEPQYTVVAREVYD